MLFSLARTTYHAGTLFFIRHRDFVEEVKFVWAPCCFQKKKKFYCFKLRFNFLFSFRQLEKWNLIRICLIRMWIPWVDFVLAGTVCQRKLLVHWGHGGSNKLVWWKSKDFLFHWQMDLESLLGEIAGKIELIVPGCLWLVKNNLHERSLLRWIMF